MQNIYDFIYYLVKYQEQRIYNLQIYFQKCFRVLILILMAQLLKLILSGLKYNKLNILQTKTEHYFAMK